MKWASVWQFAALSTAFVLPTEQVNHLRHVEVNDRQSNPIESIRHTVHDAALEIEDAFDVITDRLRNNFEHYADKSRHAIDDTLQYAEHTGGKLHETVHDTYFDSKAWLESTVDAMEQKMLPMGGHHGHHGHHGHSNRTVYELIASSNYTTKLAGLINEYPDLVKALNNTKANFTVFAPTDRAFAKIPSHAPKPSKETLKKILEYHVSPEFYPARRVLVTKTIPTLLLSDSLGDEPLPQRLSTNIGLRGLTVNFYSRIVAVDIFGSNGVIHGVDSLLIPPPNVIQIIDLLPGEFSTLELGLSKTGLLEKLNSTKHAGGTFFAPSNFAFQKLGPGVNAFLFSQYGLKYLKPLLEYHVAAEVTIYSDEIYNHKHHKDCDSVDADTNIPKGIYHLQTPSLLKGATLGVDIRRYGRLIEIRVNSFSRVTVSDGIAEDGVIHVISDVLVPPKKLANGELDVYDGSYEMSEEEFKERMAPYVDADSKTEWTDL